MIPLFRPDIEYTSAHVCECLKSGWLGPGHEVDKFESHLAELVASKHAVATTSGTTALMLSLLAFDLPPNAKILFPAYGMPAGANVARLLGYRVVFGDVDSCTGCLLPHTVTSDLDAVIFIDHNGSISGLPDIRVMCDRYGIPLIEDACQALGIDGAGMIGDVACFSFSPQKIVTTGQGGAIVTSHEWVFDKIRKLINHGGRWQATKTIVAAGGNFRFNDILASVGNAQLERFDCLLAARKHIRAEYRKHIPQIPAEDAWMIVLQLENPYNFWNAAFVHEEFQAARLYPLVTNGPFFNTTTRFHGAEIYHHKHVYLPSSGISDQEIEFICSKILPTLGA